MTSPFDAWNKAAPGPPRDPIADLVERLQHARPVTQIVVSEATWTEWQVRALADANRRADYKLLPYGMVATLMELVTGPVGRRGRFGLPGIGALLLVATRSLPDGAEWRERAAALLSRGMLYPGRLRDVDR